MLMQAMTRATRSTWHTFQVSNRICHWLNSCDYFLRNSNRTRKDSNLVCSWQLVMTAAVYWFSRTDSLFGNNRSRRSISPEEADALNRPLRQSSSCKHESFIVFFVGDYIHQTRLLWLLLIIESESGILVMRWTLWRNVPVMAGAAIASMCH